MKLLFCGALALLLAACSEADHVTIVGTGVTAEDVARLKAEDLAKGSCGNPGTTDDGETWTHQSECEKLELEAGKCDWHNSLDGLEHCESEAGDQFNVGSFSTSLGIVGAGKLADGEPPHENIAEANVMIYDQDEFQRWMGHHGDAVLARGLALWAPVFHRHHETNVPACMILVDGSLTANESAWDFHFGTNDVSQPIVAERCER